MSFGPEVYNAASTVMYSAQGAALSALALTEAYTAYKPGGRLKSVPPLAFLLSGAVMFLAMLYFLGGWSLGNALLSLRLNSGFYVFVSLACFYSSAGLSRLAFLFSGEKSLGWHYLFMVLLGITALLYLYLSGKAAPGAAAEAAAANSRFGFILLAAVLFKFLHEFRPLKVFNLAWIGLLFIVPFQLLGYRKVDGALELRAASLLTSSRMVLPKAAAGVPINNVKTAHPKRAGN
ncbi:MAG: hypothetical protein WC204_08840 [Elusimicrobiales bacterium]|jgi:hypothetical protein